MSSKEDSKLINSLNFEYQLFHKTKPMVSEDDVFELFYEVHIQKLYSPNYPINIGLFEVMVFNLEGAKKLDCLDLLFENMIDMSEDHDTRYFKIDRIVNDVDLDFKEKDRIIFLRNVVIHPDFRGKGIFDEIIKSIYMTTYTKNSFFFVNATPMQGVGGELGLYMMDYEIDVNIDGETLDTTSVVVGEYYGLGDLPDDDEMNDYKLFTRMQKLNMVRYEDTNFFYYRSENDILKLFKKSKVESI